MIPFNIQVYIDVKDSIISKKRLQPVSKQPIKQGGFGKVSKQRLIVSSLYVTSYVLVIINYIILIEQT